MAVTVRAAGEGDILALILLVGEARGPHPAPDQVASVVDVYQALLDDHDQVVRVAEVGGKLIGVLIAELRPRANWLTPELWISDLIVAPKPRPTTTLRALLKEALVVARGWQCFRVAMEGPERAAAGNAPAESLGFVNAGTVYSVSLLSGDRPTAARDAPAMSLDAAPADTPAQPAGIPITYRDLGV